ncbi:MAG: NADH:ubiquinone oxidoreductase, subunit RnfA [Ruminococcaceae bacterium]|nr:NADH:ubiquinone oxidoreductase, subunit RnfA [Oscillospiraceae bacterium]
MFENILSLVVRFVLLAIAAMTVENAVFSKGVGISRLLLLVESPVDTALFTGLMISTTVLSGIMYYFVMRWLALPELTIIYIRALVLIVCMSFAFLLVFIFSIKLIPRRRAKKAISTLPLATFNNMVLGTVLLSATSKLTFVETVIFNIGSGLGFLLAVVLVKEGYKKQKSNDVPAAFRGIPITLIYLGAIALALYGFTGFGFNI